MADAEEVSIDLTSFSELTSSLKEQLGKAFDELKAQRVASAADVQWSDIEEHFCHMESTMKKRMEEVEAKEKVYAEGFSHNQTLIAEREVVVISKEQDLLDKVQELKDVAVASILEARANHAAESLEQAGGGDADGNQVSSSIDDENGQDGKIPPGKTGENTEDLGMDVNARAELTQFCEQMDSKGLLNILKQNLENLSAMKNIKTLSDVCKEQLCVVLDSAPEPVHLVLEALEGCFPSKETTQEGLALSGMLQSCIILLEALSAFLLKAESGADKFLSPEIKQRSLLIANQWKPKLVGECVDAANVNSLEAEGFLRLVDTFRIASEFDQEQLCKYIPAVAHHRQATELCRSLGLSQKVPGLVDSFISNGRQIYAVHFIHAFQLVDIFPSVPLLKGYLKELRRNSQGNGKASVQNDCNARELEALKGVIECIEEYKLEADYPLDPLLKRVAQLDKTVKGDRKRTLEPGKSSVEPKKPRTNGEIQGTRAHGIGSSTWYTGLKEGYPPLGSAPGTYNYPVSGISPYASSQPSDGRSYYYAQNNNYAAVAPTYGAYTQPSRYPGL